MFLNQRTIEIFNKLVLSSDEAFTMEELANQFNVSERSIRWDLESIDDYLKQHHLPKLVRETKVEISLDNEDISTEQKKDLLKKLGESETYLTPLQRKRWIFIELLFQNQTIDIQHLVDQLQVSRSTVIGDMRKLKKELSEKDIFLEYTFQNGYVLEGNEYVIRREGIVLLNNQFLFKKYVEESILSELWEIIRLQDLQFIEQLVAEIEQVLKIRYSGDAFTNIVNGMLIMISRLKKNHFMPALNRHKVLKDEQYSIYIEQAEKIEKHFNLSLPEEELWFLVNLFWEGNLVRSETILNDEWINVHLLTNQFIEEMSMRLNVPLYREADLFDALILHLGPAINRLKNKIFLKNEIIQYIHETYFELFSEVESTLNGLIKDKEILFTEDEIGFITLHIASALEKLSMNERKMNVLIVCNYGIGTSRLLKTRIKKYLSYNIKGILSIRELKDSSINTRDIDLIITTIPIKEEYFVPVVEVSPLLTKEEIKTLKEIELNHSFTVSKKEVEEKKDEGEWTPMLKDLLVNGTVATNIEVDNWEEAVRFGGKLLEEKGVIEKEYIDAMIHTVKELGPYIVIAPNIAMPHASSKDGVNEVGISLITLKEPVNFGHPENDPVQIVICLAAVDHSSHLNALQDLVMYLNDKDFVEFIKSEDSAEKIVDFIEKEGSDTDGLPERNKQKN